MRTHHRRGRLAEPAQHGAIVLLVGLLHIVAAWGLKRPRPAAFETEKAMQVVFIPLQTAAVQRGEQATPRTAPRPLQRRSSHRRREPDTPAPTDPAGVARDTAALAVTRADDRWTPSPAQATGEDGIRFERANPMKHINPIAAGPPGRFRMREPASLAQVFRAVAQVLLWPPGYADDPCVGLAKAAEMLSADANTEGKRDLLRDVVRQQGQYCR